MFRSTLLLALAAVCMAQQRPSYFPRPGGFSTVLSQYRPTTGDGAPIDTADRNSFAQPANAAFQPAAPGSVNYLEDAQLNDRLQKWPREKLPFWYINKMHIESHRGQPVPCNGANCAQVPDTAQRGSFAGSAPRSSFLGSTPTRSLFERR